MTSLTPSGDRECLLEAEDERLRGSWRKVSSHCSDRGRSRPLAAGRISRASIGDAGVSVIIGVCRGTMIATGPGTES